MFLYFSSWCINDLCLFRYFYVFQAILLIFSEYLIFKKFFILLIFSHNLLYLILFLDACYLILIICSSLRNLQTTLFSGISSSDNILPYSFYRLFRQHVKFWLKIIYNIIRIRNSLSVKYVSVSWITGVFLFRGIWTIIVSHNQSIKKSGVCDHQW